jgi:CelD/BcsL family acetyltransferase involved in cellulose biosynthesis
MLLFGHDEDGEQIKGLLKSLPDYALQHSVLHQDPDYSAWPRSVASAGMEVLDYIDIARLTITSSFEEYWSSRSSNLRHNLARQRRRLCESGRRMEFVIRRRADQVPAAVVEYGRLESQGWKSETGTAIAANNAQGRFYTEVLEKFCARNETLIFQLLLDGVVAASDLCLVRNGMLVVLKTTYDETLKPLSPALLLREDELQWIFAQGNIHVVEFYGRVMDWHRKLTDDVRTMYHLNCYGHSWAPVIKRTLRRFQ